VSVWGWLWIGWLGYFAIVEGVALYLTGKAKGAGTTDPRGTLSEHLWAWFGVNPKGTGIAREVNWWARVRRLILGGFLLWLSIHLLTGGAYF